MIKNRLFTNITRSLTNGLLLLFLFSPNAVFAEEDLQPAKNFTLKNQQGTNIKLSELRGQVILLNFWAPWCGECLQQLSTLDRFHQKNKDKGFTVLAIDIDSNLQKFTSISRKVNVDFPMLLDTYNQVTPLYEVSDLPVSFLIDRDGNIRNQLNAGNILKQKETQQKISELLNE